MITELWKPVFGFAEFYEVSDLGNVRRVKQSSGTTAGKLLKPGKKADGRMYVVLSAKSKLKTLHVHRLVAEAFLGPRPLGLEINHKDGNPRNNTLRNLEYCTPKENGKHSREVLRRGVGENNYQAKLTVEMVNHIRASSDTLSNLARQFKVSPATIRDVRVGKTWKYD